MHKILNNEAYCGTLVFGGRPGHAAIHSGEPPVRVENAWPSIIDRSIFNQVQEIMSKNAPKAVHPRIVPSFYLLSGILVCGCGSAMVGRSAKSHRYYYYTCNRNCKQGREACDSKILPKKKIERLVIDQIKSKILDSECLEQLLVLVNAELDAGHTVAKEKMANIDIEIHEVENRLTSLYDALETGKLVLDDLAPRIKQLRAKQDELSKARVVAEVEMTLQGYQQLDIDAVRAYAADLWNVLEENEVAQRKAFLRSFVKKIVVEKERVKLYYNLPVPPDGRKTETVGVLPIDTPRGEYQIQPVFVEDVAEIAGSLGDRNDNMVSDAVGPEIHTFNDLVHLMREKIRSRARIVHVRPRLALFAARLIGYLVKDVVITKDEIDGLMSNLLISEGMPTGRTRLNEWLAQNAKGVGIKYISDFKWHYR